jgi:hypothetical protein
MFYAKAMYQGGIIICADEAGYDSYKKWGLRCLVCGEEVYLKRGDEKKPHFAHFKATQESQLECPLRVHGYNYAWSKVTPEGRGQRRKIFQRYLLDFFAKYDPDFQQKIHMIKTTISPNVLIPYKENCYRFWKESKFYAMEEIRFLPEHIYNPKVLLHKLVASEVVDYLCVVSNPHLCEELIYYSIYERCKKLSFDFYAFVMQAQYDKTCDTIKNLILRIDWIDSFESYSKTQLKSKSKTNPHY